MLVRFSESERDVGYVRKLLYYVFVYSTVSFAVFCRLDNDIGAFGWVESLYNKVALIT